MALLIPTSWLKGLVTFCIQPNVAFAKIRWPWDLDLTSATNVGSRLSFVEPKTLYPIGRAVVGRGLLPFTSQYCVRLSSC